jgi:hypothetical protein
LATTFLTPEPGSTRAGPWLWVVRIGALLPVLAAVAGSVKAWVPGLANICSDDASLIAVALIGMAVPYVVCLRYLWGDSIKKGLAWAVITGGFWAFLTLLIVIFHSMMGSSVVALMVSLVTLSQVVFAGAAIKVYYAMPEEEDDRRILWDQIPSFVIYGALVVILGVWGPGLLPSHSARRQALAVQSLRRIVGAESVYRQRYGEGYSRTLQSLGPPPAGESPNAFGAGLLDGVLAQGRGCDYSFTYTPGATGAQSEINAFTVASEPSEAACRVCARFFTDETGVIHRTMEDHPATRDDQKA